MPGAADHGAWAKDVIERQVKHLARLIDDLLDVSRITRGKIELRKQRIEATPIIKSAIEVVRPLIGARKHELNVSFTPGTLWCDADPTRLEQMLINLLNNAAKYTGERGHIELTADHVGDTVSFRVKDDGIGIPPEKLDEMFELFAQGDRTIARSEGGLGIGLTVVKRMAELHGGTVTAHSDGVGQGSEFTIMLPGIPAPTKPPSVVAPVAAAQERRSKILIIDDNEDIARALAKMLQLSGHDVYTAHEGGEAIKEALAVRPEIVLLDVGLPGMDGFQVAERLREEGMRNSVIIGISGYGQEEDHLRAREAGFDHHLVKPFDYDALMTLIGQAKTLS